MATEIWDWEEEIQKNIGRFIGWNLIINVPTINSHQDNSKVLKMECNLRTKLSILSLCGILLSLFATGCQRCSDLEDIVVEEAQVLCVYWSGSFSNRDTLPAIVYKTNSVKEISDNTKFFIAYSFNGKDMSKLPLKRVVSGASNDLVGFSLESRNLYSFYSDSEYVNDGPCYVQDLKAIVESGNLVQEVNSCRAIISKSDNFRLIVGLQE